jgi:hypothetical protein
MKEPNGNFPRVHGLIEAAVPDRSIHASLDAHLVDDQPEFLWGGD